MRKYRPNPKVSELSNKPGRYVVYDANNRNLLSGVAGQSRTIAYQIARNIRNSI